MELETIRHYCLSKRCVTECFPFDEQTLVFKVMDKMFAVLPLDNAEWLTVKCDPDRAIALRDEYTDIQPAYHFNKRHWNQLRHAGLSDALVAELIDHSYDLVVSKLPKRVREEMGAMETAENKK